MMNSPQLLQTVSKIVGAPLGERYHLRLLQPSDAPALFALVDANRTYLRQWLPWLDQTRAPSDSQGFIASCQTQLMQNVGLTLAIGRPQEQSGESRGDAIAGIISLDPIDWLSRSGHIGYWLAQPYQGQGLMTQACQALTDYGFSSLNLHRIVIACATENYQSRAIPERLGFMSDGCISQAEWLYNRYVDHQVYVKFYTAESSSHPGSSSTR